VVECDHNTGPDGTVHPRAQHEVRAYSPGC
jgi:hypothetical protein